MSLIDQIMYFLYSHIPSFDAGSIFASVFSLVVICLGAGTITIPYVIYQNGIILGSVFILMGAAVSFYAGYLIAYCAEKTGGKCYEDIANRLYG